MPGASHSPPWTRGWARRAGLHDEAFERLDAVPHRMSYENIPAPLVNRRT